MVRDPRGGHNRKKVNEDFFKTWTPKMSYVLGFMFADGSLLDTNSSSRTYYVQFSNNDLRLLKDIRKVMSSEHKIYIRPVRVMEHKEKKYISGVGYVFKFGNKVMYQDLLDLGMTHRTSNNMQFPLIPPVYFSYFLRGYFDGDGCVNLSMPRGRLTPRIKVIFTSGSTDFLSSLASLLSWTLNIKEPVFYKSTGAYNLTANDSVAVRILDYMYRDLDLAPYLDRKYQKYLDYKNNLMGPRIKKALSCN